MTDIQVPESIRIVLKHRIKFITMHHKSHNFGKTDFFFIINEVTAYIMSFVWSIALFARAMYSSPSCSCLNSEFKNVCLIL